MFSVIPLKNSIFSRLLLTFILVLLPLFVFGFSIYNWGLNAISYEIKSSTQSQLNFYRDNLDKEIERIRFLMFNVISDESLAFVSEQGIYMDNYDRDMSLLSIQQRILALKNSSRYIDEVRVGISGIKKIVTPLSIWDSNSDEWVKLEHDYSSFDGSLNYSNGRLFLGAVPLNKNSALAVKPGYYIEVTLLKSELKKMLQDLLTYNGSGVFIYGTNNKLFIDGSSQDTISEHILEAIDQSGLMVKSQPDALTSMQYGNGTVTYNGDKYYVSYAKMSLPDLVLIRYIPEGHVFAKITQYSILFLLSSVTALIIIIVFSFSTYRFIHRPMSKLKKAFFKLEKGDMNVEIIHNHKDEFNDIFIRFNSMVKNLGNLIDQVYKQKIMVQKAELKQLQSQINPHFLYNSFFILTRRIEAGDTESAMMFSEQLGCYFQFITRSAADEVPLSKEVEHAKIYADIQGMRFYNRIKIDFQPLPEELKDLIVPRLVLQPLIENSFEHSLENMEENGLLCVRFSNEGKFVRIIVEDNGNSLINEDLQRIIESVENFDASAEVTGMINIHRRLRLKFGEHSGLSVTRGELGGLKVALNIETREENVYVQASDSR